MYKIPLQRYRRLSHLLPFDLIVDKLYGVLVFACTLPLIVLSLLIVLVDDSGPQHMLLAVAGLASLAALAISIWMVHAIIAPVSLARLALHAYHREHRLLAVPTDLDGEAGGLLNDVRTTLETCERQRRVFAEQADWAFRGKRSPLLSSNGAPRRAPQLEAMRSPN